MIEESATYKSSSSAFSKNVIATPRLPARPVRPAQRTKNKEGKYQSTSWPTPVVCSGKRTDTMHVSLDVVGHLVIDDKRDIRHIDTTTRQVGGDQNGRLA